MASLRDRRALRRKLRHHLESARGLVDAEGPVLDTLESSPNYQLNVRPRELVLEFDEYVVLKDATRKVTATPRQTPVRRALAGGRRVTPTYPR